jgi:hypothetical protein
LNIAACLAILARAQGILRTIVDPRRKCLSRQSAVWPIKAASATDIDAYSIACAFFGWVDIIGRVATAGLIIRP